MAKPTSKLDIVKQIEPIISYYSIFEFQIENDEKLQLTTLDFDGTQLPVHWKILQIHRTRGRDGQPVCFIDFFLMKSTF